MKSMRASKTTLKTFIYILCIFLAILSIIPFWVMIVNSTRSTSQISSGISLLPSVYFQKNWAILESYSNVGFNALVGFKNSLIVSVGSTLLATYFSSLTAYGLAAYSFRGNKSLFTFIMCVMMIPAQISAIGFFQFMYNIHLNNSLLPLIVPAIASPSMVFFMRQYLLANLSIEMVEAARIDGSHEFRTFNRIILPIMTPAIATQAIFAFIGSWNSLFMPLILLQNKELKTMPVMVSMLRGNIYRTEYGSIYLALTLTSIPLFIMYFLLSRYIIAGVALGGVKE